MDIYKNLGDLPKFRNTVITIGSYDGVHNGHQGILSRVRELAEEHDAISIVITFDPHPRIALHPNDPTIQLLTTTEEKGELLDTYGIDVMVVVPFSLAFAQQSPDTYIQDFLVRYFHPKFIVIGYDHRFGSKRVGDLAYLKKFEAPFGYEVVEIERQTIEATGVSSSKIRRALEQGDVYTATKLLGHYFTFSGFVVKGQQIGREIGFPTANLEITNRYKLLPPHGIYAVYIWVKGVRHQGMLYRGNRPVLKDHHNTTIEVNIFDFDEDIYGEYVKVELVDYIRPDQHFATLEDLVIQLADDEKKSKGILQNVELMSLPRIAVVILNFNGRAYLEQFLPSVMTNIYRNVDIIVADNASTDDSVAFLREKYDAVKIIQLEKNHGFAAGYNEALQILEDGGLLERAASETSRESSEIVKYRYYVLLNSDVKVSQHWLLPLTELMESNPRIGACQPKIISFKKKRFFEYAGAAGGWIDALGYPFSKGRIFDQVEKDHKQYETVDEIFWASGAAMYVRAELYHRLGGFDGDYFAHQEEIDLCWRMKRAGYKVMSQPKSVVRHVGGGTLDYENPKKTFLNFRNNLWTILKNEDSGKLFWLIPVRLALDGVAGIKFLVGGKYRNTWAIIRAHFAVYGSFSAILKKRKAYNGLIATASIGKYNKNGIYPGSIVFQYYVRGKRRFSELMKQ